MNIKDKDYKQRMSLYLPSRIKRRVKNLSEDTDISMNDIIVDAIKDYLDRKDAEYSAPDLVAERVSELINSQIAVVQTLNKQTEVLNSLQDSTDNLSSQIKGDGDED